MASSNLIIAFADDDQDDREFFIDAIGSLDTSVQILQFKNGADLIGHLESCGNESPDLIFLDLNMPVMNGKQCLRKLRLSLTLNKLPVIIFSTSDSESDVNDTYNLGANLYLKKTYSLKALRESLSEILCMPWKADMTKPERNGFLFRPGRIKVHRS